MAAALMPLKPMGRLLSRLSKPSARHASRPGLMNAVNMDTGYVNYLSETEKRDVLRWTRSFGQGCAIRFWRLHRATHVGLTYCSSAL
jgi:hypothetical protein